MSFLLILLMLSRGPLFASTPPAAGDALSTIARIEWSYRVEANVAYTGASKLDVYATRWPDKPLPTVVFFHAGGWTQGTKEQRNLSILPYLALGMNVVNVDYRLASEAHAPAAVEDARCAVAWTIHHAKEYGFDSKRVVLAGDSAGAHLALLAAFVTPAAGFDTSCAVPAEFKVAAVVNWYGIADVADLLHDPNARGWAIEWIGGGAHAAELAARVSPMTYVRAGLPPVFTIHGDADRVAPYEQAVRLHKALSTAHVPNQLMTVHGGSHGFGCCDVAQRRTAYRAIETFLRRHRVLN